MILYMRDVRAYNVPCDSIISNDSNQVDPQSFTYANICLHIYVYMCIYRKLSRH